MYIFYLIISNIIHVFISLVSASTFLQPDPNSCRTDLILVTKTYTYGSRWVCGHVTILVYYHVTCLCLRNRDIIGLDDYTKFVMFLIQSVEQSNGYAGKSLGKTDCHAWWNKPENKRYRSLWFSQPKEKIFTYLKCLRKRTVCSC